MNLRQYAEHCATLPTEVLRGMVGIVENHLPTVDQDYRQGVQDRLDVIKGILRHRSESHLRRPSPFWA